MENLRPFQQEKGVGSEVDFTELIDRLDLYYPGTSAVIRDALSLRPKLCTPAEVRYIVGLIESAAQCEDATMQQQLLDGLAIELMDTSR